MKTNEAKFFVVVTLPSGNFENYPASNIRSAVKTMKILMRSIGTKGMPMRILTQPGTK